MPNTPSSATTTSPSSPPRPKVALITGAASGMGLALTRHLVSQNWRVGMCDLNASAGISHAAELNATPHPAGGDRVLFRTVDITDYAQQGAFFAEVFAWAGQGGGIDYFAANAGIRDGEGANLLRDVEGVEVDETGVPRRLDTRVLDVNLRAVFEGIWLFRFFAAKARRMGKGRGSGKITVTASSAALYPFHGQPAYTASKSALVGLVRSTYRQLKKEGIQINALCPPFVDTPFLPREFARAWPKEHLVKVEDVVKAHEVFIQGGEEMTGKTLELSQGERFWREMVPYPNESQRWINEESDGYFRELARVEREKRRGRGKGKEGEAKL